MIPASGIVISGCRVRGLLFVLLLAMLLAGGTVAPGRAGRASAAPPAPGTIATFAGGGVGDGGPAASASLYFAHGVAVDSAGNLYIADYNNCRVREVAGGVISTAAGTGTCGYRGDGHNLVPQYSLSAEVDSKSRV